MADERKILGNFPDLTTSVQAAALTHSAEDRGRYTPFYL